MLSFVKSVVTYVQDLIWEDADPSDGEEDSPQSALQRISHAALKGPTHVAVGVITYISFNQGCIDEKFYFPLHLSDNKLQVGDRVKYTAIITKGNGRLIESIQLVGDADDSGEVAEILDKWEDAEDAALELVTVTERIRRLIKLSNNVECNLDNVILKDNFLPIAGDSVLYSFKDGLEYLRPSNMIVGQGSIVKLINNEFGVIKSYLDEEAIFFKTDALDTGYEPVDGDVVNFIAVHSDAGSSEICKWRASSVSFQASGEVVQDEMPLFCEGKLVIDGSSNFENLIVNADPKILTLHIYNPNDVAHTLRKISFRRRQTQIKSETPTPLTIPPQGFEPVIFSCRAVFCGRNHEIVDFMFDNGTIARRFEMDATATEISQMLQGTIPAGMQRNKTARFPMMQEEWQQKTFGPRPQTPRKMFKKPGQYAVPKKIQEIYNSMDSETNQTDALAGCCPELKNPLNPKNYTDKFHTLLYIEHMAVKEGVSRLSRSHVFFRQNGDMLVLDIPGLAEQRPSLIVNDRVVVTQPWSDQHKTAHVGIIHGLSRDSIYVKFHDSFQSSYAGTDCEVSFETCGGGFSHMHDALIRASSKLGEPVLFPTKLSVSPPNAGNLAEMVWYNKSLNEGQRRAVISAINAVCRPLPHIIFGPPGTGKTVTVVEAVLQTMRLCGDARIVVAAPSNSAADLLCQRLIYWGKLRPGEIVRLMAFSRAQESIPEDLEPYCISGTVEEQEDQSTVSLGWHRITVGTCMSLSGLHLHNFPPGFFTHVFIDEAGYATEPQTLIPLTLIRGGRGVAVLAGDPEQLGPVVLSAAAIKFGLADSFLARVTKRFPYARDRDSFPDTQGFDPRLITRLTQNYRSVPEILALPNKLFYNSELQPTVMGTHGREAEIMRAFFKAHPLRDEPVSIMFHGVRGDNVQEHDSPSWLNPQELFETVQYVRLLYSVGVKASELAIITPYRKQVTKIRHFLEEFDLEVPKVGSVEELQGQERQVVILSCVRSRSVLLEKDRRFCLGFLSNPRRVNVAITRARCLLIVIGNPHVLQHDTHWRSLITYCIERRAYKGCDLPACLDPESERDLAQSFGIIIFDASIRKGQKTKQGEWEYCGGRCGELTWQLVRVPAFSP